MPLTLLLNVDYRFEYRYSTYISYYAAACLTRKDEISNLSQIISPSRLEFAELVGLDFNGFADLVGLGFAEDDFLDEVENLGVAEVAGFLPDFAVVALTEVDFVVCEIFLKTGGDFDSKAIALMSTIFPLLSARNSIGLTSNTLVIP